MTSSKTSKLSPVELERENERLLDETTKLESDVARWEAACKRAETTYYGEVNDRNKVVTVSVQFQIVQPVEQIEVDFKFDDAIGYPTP